MKNIVVVGTQWGDEGKGKIVDFLSEEADVIVRFQGGHNAGHTLVIDGTTYKLSILPSGIIRKDKISIIGNGVVLNPWSLLDEIEKIKKFGITISNKNLKISKSAPLILPIHSLIDNSREIQRGISKIGTTGRGIGPAYEDKVARRAIRVSDLEDPKLLKEKILKIVDHHNIWLKAMNVETADAEKIYLDLLNISNLILNYAEDTWVTLQELKDQGKKILFEGAQGAMLDIDHGTYPFVTSSSTVAGQAASGSGFGSTNLNSILGITKAYTTRVGEGPFPTELTNDIGELLGTRGKEFGTVTSRKRRCGWFDGVLVRQTIKVSGIDGIALTKLDVLDELDEIKMCVAYELDGERLDYLPAAVEDQIKIKPIYETFPGWKVSTSGVKNMDSLPENAKKYIFAVEDFIGAKISSISTSPERDDTILIENPFEV